MSDVANPTRLAARQGAAGERMDLRLHLIGRMEAWTAAGQNVLPGGRKTRGLLALIAIAAPRAMPRSQLAETLWSSRPGEQARASLRQELHKLQEALVPVRSEVLSVSRDYIALRSGIMWSDLGEIERGRSGAGVVPLPDGELLADLDGIDPAFDAWLAHERHRLRDSIRAAAEARLREPQDPDIVIPAAQRLLALDRSHEGAWLALMRAHMMRGERGAALEAYERCRQGLAELLDAEPSEEMQQLMLQVRMGAPARADAMLPALRADAESAEHELAISPLLVQGSPPAPRLESLAPGPRLGVLPLRMIGIDAAEQSLATGLAEEVTIALARCRWIAVVGAGALAQFAATSCEVIEMRRALGLDFLLEGTVQRAQERLRIILRLIDLRAGSQVVWARRFDREWDDPLALQDEIAAEVAAQIDPEILLIEARRAERSAVGGPAGGAPNGFPAQPAWQFLLRAIPSMNSLDRSRFVQAGDLLARSIAADPEFGAPHAWFACWHTFLVAQNWAEDRAEAIRRAAELAERAIILDPLDPASLTMAGHVRAFLQRRSREAVALHARALMLNPSLALAWALSGLAHAYLGELEEADRRMRRYKALAPLYPGASTLDAAFVIISLLRHEHQEAVAVARQIIEISPTLLLVCKPYLAALGHLGLWHEAVQVLRRLREMEPDFSVARFLATTPFERLQDREHYAAGLRRAGVPDENPGAA
jgi:TolB-like protein/DNA-binding SARP family transcriptional activator